MFNDDFATGQSSWRKQNRSAGRQDAHCEVAVSATGYKRAKTTAIDKEDTVPMHHLEKYYLKKKQNKT